MCRSKSSKGDRIEKVYEYVIAGNSLKRKISQMKAVEDFESRPHEAVSFVVEGGQEIQEWNEQKLPKVLPGHSGKKAEKRRRQIRRVEREESGMTSRKRWLQASRRRQALDGVKEAAQRSGGQRIM